MIYSELVAAMKLYSDRNDLEVAASVDLYIELAEARINRVLKTREQSARIFSPTIEGEEYYSLPPDYAGMRDFQLNSDAVTVPHSTRPYVLLAPDLFNVQRNKPYAGTNYYSIISDQIQIYPCQKAGLTLEMVYYQKVPNLNSVNVLNWVSNSHPDIYLAGCVGEIELFVKNYDVADGWFGRMTEAIGELDSADVKERWSGSTLTTRVG